MNAHVITWMWAEIARRQPPFVADRAARRVHTRAAEVAAKVVQARVEAGIAEYESWFEAPAEKEDES